MWVGRCLRKEGCEVMQGWRYGGVQLGRWNEPPCIRLRRADSTASATNDLMS